MPIYIYIEDNPRYTTKQVGDTGFLLLGSSWAGTVFDENSGIVTNIKTNLEQIRPASDRSYSTKQVWILEY